jgi:hypothetical protein
MACAVGIASVAGVLGLFVCYVGMSVSVKFFHGQERCGELDLMGKWSYPEGVRHNPSTTELFRKIRSPREAICVAQKVAFTDELSNERLCFEKGKGELFPITWQQWDAGTPVPEIEPYSGPRGLAKRLGNGFHDHGLEYGGHSFPRAGRHWVKMQDYAVLLSPSGKYIAVQSVDHDNDKDYLFFRSNGREPSSTNVYIQVYELSSGDELLRARVSLNRINADSTYASTHWMDGDHLWISPSPSSEKYSCTF